MLLEGNKKEHLGTHETKEVVSDMAIFLATACPIFAISVVPPAAASAWAEGADVQR